MYAHGSKGFPRTQNWVSALDSRELLQDGKGCGDIDVIAAVTWQACIVAEEPEAEAVDVLRPGSCADLRYLSDGQSGLACSAIWGIVRFDLTLKSSCSFFQGKVPHGFLSPVCIGSLWSSRGAAPS